MCFNFKGVYIMSKLVKQVEVSVTKTITLTLTEDANLDLLEKVANQEQNFIELFKHFTTSVKHSASVEIVNVKDFDVNDKNVLGENFMPLETENLTFLDVSKFLDSGHHIARKVWVEDGKAVHKPGRKLLHSHTGVEVTITTEDFNADDWFILPLVS